MLRPCIILWRRHALRPRLAARRQLPGTVLVTHPFPNASQPGHVLNRDNPSKPSDWFRPGGHYWTDAEQLVDGKPRSPADSRLTQTNAGQAFLDPLGLGNIQARPPDIFIKHKLGESDMNQPQAPERMDEPRSHQTDN